MERAKYNACIGDRLRGKKLTRVERKTEFCVSSKLCSMKAGSEEEARSICALPKAARASKVDEPQLSCTERLARVRNSLDTIQLKVRSGEAEDVVGLASQTLKDIGTCVKEPGTVELFDEAMGLVKTLGGRFYLSGEAKDLKGKIDILKELV